jgi:two-component system, chemotaxis family, chemotaxis protein CheY
MAGYQLDRLSVLVMDDSETMRKLLKTMLRSFGIGKVKAVEDGSAALEIMRAGRSVDIAIADLAMKPMDGIQFLKILRNGEDSPNPMLPVILMTAHSERHLIEQARDAGVTEAVAKPISARALWQKLEAVIERPRQFIRSANYVGPDRRRRADPSYAGPERRKSDIWKV